VVILKAVSSPSAKSLDLFFQNSSVLAEVYCNGTKILYRGLYESDVIGVEPHDEEEYQLYLKLKEKYG
jgi:hypothetical protein